MAGARFFFSWLAAAAIPKTMAIAVAMVLASGAVEASDEMADIVPRADDVSLKLTIENIDGKVVNVPEASFRRIAPGDHYLGIKIEFRSVSGGSLISGLGVISAISGAISDKAPAHDGVSFTALPGRRYLVNGAMVDGKAQIWVEEVVKEDTRQDDLR